MEDEKLIECVRKYEFLYNLQHPKYMDTLRKDIAWKKISEKMKQSAAACKQRWQGLRDAYRRALNKRKSKSPQAAKNSKKWKYEDEMSFVTPFFLEKKRLLESVELTTDEERLKNTYDEFENEVKYTTVVDAADPDKPLCTEIQNKNRNVAQNNTPQTKRTKMKVQPVQSASDLLMVKLLEEQNKLPQQGHDEIDRFFLSISETVKKFSPYQQAVAKNKIFSVVSEMELEQLKVHRFTHSPKYSFPNACTPSPPSTSSGVQKSVTSISPEHWND